MRTMLILLLSAAPAAAAERIGAAGAVAGKVQAASEGIKVGRIVNSGETMYLNDRVTTGAGGRLQVLLLDETVFTVGPHSDLVLDEFVYDPDTSVGKVAASVTKGAFRFVTGKIARQQPANMKVKTPVGTIGIRGTMAGGIIGDNSATVILLGPGADNNAGETPGGVTVSNEHGSINLDRPGYGTSVTGGQAPSAPRDMSLEAGQLASALEPEPSDSSAAGDSPAEASGQAIAGGGALALEAGSANAGAEEFGKALTAGNQELGDFNGLTSWDFIRSQLNAGSGTYFSGESSVSCTNCAGAVLGSLQLQVNFGARTLGGGSSFIHLHNVYSGGDTVQQTISSIDFSTLTGAAKVELNPYLGVVSGGSGTFNGTVVSLVNADGVVAKEAHAAMKFDGLQSISNPTASGTIKAPR